MATLTWLVMVPFAAMLAAQLLVGWHSDRKNERWLHTAVPLAVGAVGLALVPSSSTTLALTVACFSLALAGLRACMPGFWSLPNLFLSEAAAAGSIGFINAFGNLGGFLGPTVLGKVQSVTGSFVGGMYFLVACAATSSLIVFGMRWSALRANKPRREPPPSP
jgi:ACS family tartrate transporter-like MFS transporter